jgi:hypothetical protein
MLQKGNKFVDYHPGCQNDLRVKYEVISVEPKGLENRPKREN